MAYTILTAEERIRLVEMIAFYEGHKLRDDQKAHLVTLYELRDAVSRLAIKQRWGADTTGEDRCRRFS